MVSGVREEVAVFGALGNLVGMLTLPARATAVALVLLNAGLIHRVGPGRLYVRLARAAAARGYASVRFDFSGIGDSPARHDGLPVLEMAAREPAEAVDLMMARGCERAVLIGICSGALAALRAGARDPRVAAVALINPPAFSRDDAVGAAGWARRYTGRSLTSARAWGNLLTGRVDYRRLVRALAARVLGGGERAAADPDLAEARAQLAAIVARGGRVLFLLSGSDVAVDHVGVLLGADVRDGAVIAGAAVRVIAGADHLFLREADKTAVEAILLALADEVAG